MLSSSWYTWKVTEWWTAKSLRLNIFLLQKRSSINVDLSFTKPQKNSFVGQWDKILKVKFICEKAAFLSPFYLYKLVHYLPYPYYIPTRNFIVVLLHCLSIPLSSYLISPVIDFQSFILDWYARIWLNMIFNIRNRRRDFMEYQNELLQCLLDSHIFWGTQNAALYLMLQWTECPF